MACLCTCIHCYAFVLTMQVPGVVVCMQGREEGLQKLKLRVISTPHRKHVVFSGASVLADIMSSSSKFWISRGEWAQNPKQALKKCMHL